MYHHFELIPDYIVYLPSVAAFLQTADLTSKEAQASLREIRSDSRTRNQIDQVINSLTSIPAIQIDYLKMKNKVGWINASELDRQVKSLVQPFLKTPSAENVLTICASYNSAGKAVDLRREDFDESQITSWVQLGLFQCAKTSDESITKNVVSHLKNLKPENLPSTLQALRLLPGASTKVASQARIYAQSSNPKVRDEAQAILLTRGTDAEKRTALFSLLNSKTYMSVAAQEINRKQMYEDDSLGSKVIATGLKQNPNSWEAASLAAALPFAVAPQSKVWSADAKKLLSSLPAENIATVIQDWQGPRVQNQTIKTWGIETLLSAKSLEDPYLSKPLSYLLSQQHFNANDVKQLLNFAQTHPDDGRLVFIRGLLRTQTDVPLSSQQKKLISGMASTVACEDNSPCVASTL